MVSTSPPRSRSPPPEGGSASHQLRTYVRTYQNLELRLGLQEIYVRTYHTYVRTYVYFLKPQEVPNGTHVRTIAHGRRSITRTYRFTYVRTSTYVPFHPRTNVRTSLTYRTYRFTHVLQSSDAGSERRVRRTSCLVCRAMSRIHTVMRQRPARSSCSVSAM